MSDVSVISERGLRRTVPQVFFPRQAYCTYQPSVSKSQQIGAMWSRRTSSENVRRYS